MPQRFENLQILRGVACGLVLVYHLAQIEAMFGIRFTPLRPVQWFGYAGVDLFFVLSGFIITAISLPKLGQPQALPRYLGRRVWRIYPPYFFALVLAGLVYTARGPEPLFPTIWPYELIDTLLLLPQANVPRILPVAWTLSYELLFYAVFGLLFLLPRRVGGGILSVWAVGILAVAVTGYLPANRFAVCASSPFVLEFLAGCALAWWAPKLNQSRAWVILVVGLVWCAVASWFFFDPNPTTLATHHVRRVLVFGPTMTLLVLGAIGCEQAGRQWRLPRLSRLGDASYSVYLLHIPAWMLTLEWTIRAKMPHTPLGHTLWLVLMLTVGIGAGLLMHRFVEKPLLNWRSRKPKVAEEPNPSIIQASRVPIPRDRLNPVQTS